MPIFAQRTPKVVTAAAALVAIGFSSLVVFSAPAVASPLTCVQGVLVGGDICELTITSSSTFTPDLSMTDLQVLLVGGGGDGVGNGYGGGGGEVIVKSFSDLVTPLSVVVGLHGQATVVTQGSETTTARAGLSTAGSSGGNSGSGFSGTPNPEYDDSLPQSGAGDSGSPVDGWTGGPGTVVSTATASDLPFSNDTTCYGGGGAVGKYGVQYGESTCGGGYTQDGDIAGELVDPVAGSGGGGSSLLDLSAFAADGAGGVVVVRWWAAPTQVTGTFNLNGHGDAISSQSVTSGNVLVAPHDPAADGFVFGGWFYESDLINPVNFAEPISADTTLYAAWSAVIVDAGDETTTPATLPVTGAEINPLVLPAGILVLLLGGGLALWSARRARQRRKKDTE